MRLAPLFVFASLFVLPDAATAQGPGFPTTPPPAAPVKPATFPPFQEAVLPNGVRVVLVERHDQPVLSLSMAFPAGESYAPAGKEGLADMTAGLLTKGAGSRSAEEIASAIEGVGGTLDATTSRDFLTVSANVLSGDAPLAFSLLGDAVARPTFPDKEVELRRTQTLSALQLQLSQPASIASRTFRRMLYGESPYARSATPASVRSITRADLTQFRSTRLTPAGALLVVAGDITMPRVKQLAADAFKGWTGAAPARPALSAPPARTRTEIVLVNRPGSVQANVVAGNTTFRATDPRSYAATVANKVLGGGADARLFDILREKKGWTYGAYSSIATSGRTLGYFTATAEVRTEVADSALVELLAQLRRIGSEPVPPAELDAAKSALVGSFPLSIETAGEVASQVATMKLYGLPADYLRTYRTRLAAVTAAQALAAAKSTIRPSQALVVVVGDAAKLYPKLQKIAPVTLVDVEGKPMSPSDLEAKAAAVAAPLDLDLSKLVARTDSFAVMVQGNPLGYTRTALEKTAAGFRYTDRTQIAAFVQQSTELTFSDKVEMQALKQTGKVQGQDTKVEVDYAGGRAKGSASVPSPQGLKTTAVDAALPAGAIDDNAVQAIVPALKWSPAAKFTFNIFTASKNAVRPATLAVTGTEKVTVPAGTFDAYRAELTGGDQPVTMYVTSAAPYRVVKIAVAGTPLEIVLVK